MSYPPEEKYRAYSSIPMGSQIVIDMPSLDLQGKKNTVKDISKQI